MVSCGRLWQVIDSTNHPADIDAFNVGGYLQSVALPVAKIGHGNSGVTGKYEAVFSSVKLDVAPAQHLSNLSLNDTLVSTCFIVFKTDCVQCLVY